MTEESGNTITILIAEDDPALRKLLAKGLKQAGFRSIEAGSGEEAVRLCVEQRPALALLDIRMPGMSGTEAAAVIRRETDVPFMFLSGMDEIELVKEAVKDGALGYLAKPIDIHQLAPAIHAALASAEERRRLRVAESNLVAALEVSRETSVAIGILMERHRLTQNAAFEALRNEARSQRRKLSDIAETIVAAAETLNSSVAPTRQKNS